MRFSLILGLSLMLMAFTGLGEPAQVIVIRHAEKPEDPRALHLSPRGKERAKALVKFFTETKKLNRFGLPVALYASRATRHGHGQRTGETVEPLAKELGLSIQMPYESEDYSKLAQEVLRNPKYQGKTVVICWVHEYLPELVSALGVKPEPPKWKESVYDKAYVITYENGKGQLDTVWQKLLPGDNKYKD